MHSINRTFSIIVIACFAGLLTNLALAQGSPEDIGVIDRTNEAAILPISIDCQDAKLENLLKGAFHTHGAFLIVPQAQAKAQLAFFGAGENAVGVSISTGTSVVNRKASGSSITDAAMKAADEAVKLLTGNRGYFGGKLAFVSNRSGHDELYISDLFFQKIVLVGPHGSIAVSPAFSPDGNKLLYTSYQRGGPDIYQINLSGNTFTPTPYMTFKGTNTGASFHPSGNTVAMIVSGYGNAEVVFSDGPNRVSKRLTRTRGLESDPDWSPDGRQVVFASDEPGKPQLFVMDASGGSMKRLPTNISGYCAEPDWNPMDANLIAFTIAQGGEFEIAIYDRKQRKSRVVTRGPGDAVEPVWLADGRHLLYTARSSNNRYITVLDTVTGKTTPLHNRNFGSTFRAAYVYP